MRALRPLLVLLVALLAGAASGLALGAISPYIYVALLGPLLIGVTVGSAAALAALTTGASLGRPALLAAGVGVLAALIAVQVLEDRAMRRGFTDDYARASMVASGVPEEASTDADELAFYAGGAASALDTQVRKATGHGGAWGRWLFRADAGVRLFGPAAQSRGLAVGRAGAVVFAVLELVLALAVSALVLRRVRRRRDAEAQPP
ncbi:MAG: hypothetical protein H6744_07310 [Deltaproteobacteria bacterium]|nr:hypothetical protein [Deltaproteobacteria bacterium]MCB9786487.1 hypothetical protein [Deltaproteobacteria bacterium]